jgi:hypothetical protein
LQAGVERNCPRIREGWWLTSARTRGSIVRSEGKEYLLVRTFASDKALKTLKAELRKDMPGIGWQIAPLYMLGQLSYRINDLGFNERWRSAPTDLKTRKSDEYTQHFRMVLPDAARMEQFEGQNGILQHVDSFSDFR